MYDDPLSAASGCGVQLLGANLGDRRESVHVLSLFLEHPAVAVLRIVNSLGPTLTPIFGDTFETTNLMIFDPNLSSSSSISDLLLKRDTDDESTTHRRRGERSRVGSSGAVLTILTIKLHLKCTTARYKLVEMYNTRHKDAKRLRKKKCGAGQ